MVLVRYQRDTFMMLGNPSAVFVHKCGINPNTIKAGDQKKKPMQGEEAATNSNNNDNDSNDLSSIFPDDNNDEFSQRAESHKYISKLEKRVQLVRERQSRQGVTLEEKRKIENFSGKEMSKDNGANTDDLQQMTEDVVSRQPFRNEEEEENSLEEQEVTMDSLGYKKGLTKRFYNVETGELELGRSSNRSWWSRCFFCL
jgi:hypothetical protein